MPKKKHKLAVKLLQSIYRHSNELETDAETFRQHVREAIEESGLIDPEEPEAQCPNSSVKPTFENL